MVVVLRVSQVWAFCRDCLNRSKSRYGSPPPISRKGTDKAVTRVILSIRSGVLGCGLFAWRIPVSGYGVDIFAVVDTAAKITILSENVHDVPPPPPAQGIVTCSYELG